MRQVQDLKHDSGQFQTDANTVNSQLNEFMFSVDDKLKTGEYSEWEIRDEELGNGGMTQIDPPSLQLDAGPADTTIDAVVDDLEGIVVLC
jgi:hypothetical protein